MKKIIRLAKTGICVLLTVAFAGSCGGTGARHITKTTPDSYPLHTDQTLVYWLPIHTHVQANYKTLNETPFAKGLRERTGISVEFVHPAEGNGLIRLQEMLLSGDMPDIMEYNWNSSYPGGPDQAIADGIIIPLNEAIDKVSPNLKKWLEEHPDRDRLLNTDKGNYYGYPFSRKERQQLTFQGFMIRQDLLEKAGETAALKTIADWERVLYKFKEMGVKYPLNIRKSHMLIDISGITGAFGIKGDFYAENGTVKFGPYEPQFQDCLKVLAKWYRDGILDQDYIDEDLSRLKNMVANGEVGIISGSNGGEFGEWIPLLEKNVPGSKMIPMEYPAMHRDERPKFGQMVSFTNGESASITTKSEKAELCARFLDYGYSEQGYRYYNFGEEGVSYTMQEGKPVYTQAVLDPNLNGGNPISFAISAYTRAAYFGPFIQDPDYLPQYYALDAQKQALSVWCDTDEMKYKMPNTVLTLQEKTEFDAIMGNVWNYVWESFKRYVNGMLDAQDMDVYYRELKVMGIERAVQLQQAAYERALAK